MKKDISKTTKTQKQGNAKRKQLGETKKNLGDGRPRRRGRPSGAKRNRR